jgi:tetratricopeptide (TPR) repeat protein
MGTNYQEQSVDVEIYGYGASGRQLADAVQRDIYLKLRKGAESVPFVNAVVFAQEVPSQAQAAYERGTAYLNEKKRDEGVAELKKALEIFPDYFLVLQKLGIMYISDQKYDEAKKMFKRSLDVNPNSFDSLYGLGYSEYGLGNFQEAVNSSEKALAIKPDSLEVNLLLGVSYRQIKQYDKSEKAFLKAQDLADGTAPDVHYQLALLYAHNLKRYGDAAKQLELFLKEAPDAKDKDAIKKLIKQFKEKDDKK